MPAPPLANERCNKTFANDGTIHHVTSGTGKEVCLKAQTRVPRSGQGQAEGRGVTKFISYYTLKRDLVMTSRKFNQVLDSGLP